MYGVILAGGSGTRFWPKSRELYPKQLLNIFGQKTMIQNTVERLLPLIPIENIMVVTNDLHAIETCHQLAGYGFKPSQLLAEPLGRNTAAAIALAAHVLFSKNASDKVMAVFPADHIVFDPEVFLQTLQTATAAARKNHIVTLGVKPTRPDTGYGYIKKCAPLGTLNDVFQVERFVEKPDLNTAKSYLAQGDYFWNCGVFLWKVSTVLEEIKTYMPDLSAKMAGITEHIIDHKGKFIYRTLNPEGREIYQSLSSISIDYGVMEKSGKTVIVPSLMQWNDVGSWSSLEDIFPKDPQGNVFNENVVSLDCTESIIQSNKRLIAGVGLKNMIVIDTPDALLVCQKDRAQDVKNLVEIIKKEHRPEATIHTTVQRPWGTYTVLEKGEKHILKRIDVRPGGRLSLQSHHHRDEHWFVLSGQAEVQREDKVDVLNSGDSINIPKGTKHRLGNPGAGTLTIFEVQTGDFLDESDIVRYDDEYGR